MTSTSSPICRLCHVAHALSAPHVFTKSYSTDDDTPAERKNADRADKAKLGKALTKGLPKSEAKALKVVIAKIEAKSPTSPKRKEYLKLKAKERRAAAKAGLSIAEYRKRQAAP